MFRIQGIDHVVLRASQPHRLISFYRDALGCVVEREVSQVGLTQLRAGGSLIDIIQATAAEDPGTIDPPDQVHRNLDHFCLRVDPFDFAQLDEHFAKFNVEIRKVELVYGAQGYGPAVYIQDPEGNTVELKGPSTNNTDGRDRSV
ncbi:MAG: VOC family protein [Gammaproteobacteria bacterium]|nr:VOC family protein [Gammaproteobacteria bacterium]